MQVHYILVDCENVQPDGLHKLKGDHFRVKLFVGSSQSKISLQTAAAVQHMGKHAEYVRIAGNGPNALDFHIAYYLGRLTLEAPAAHFHIVSRDTGFDPLVAHLKAQEIAVVRSESVGGIPLLKAKGDKPVVANGPAVKPAKAAAVKATASGERLGLVIANLRKRGNSSPRSVVTLKSSINNLFQKSLSDAEQEKLVKGLVDRGLVTVTDTKISYALGAGTP